MGFLTNTTTIELIAKLTPQGRAKLVSNTNTLITSFSLGDSDAYYSSYTGVYGGFGFEETTPYLEYKHTIICWVL